MGKREIGRSAVVIFALSVAALWCVPLRLADGPRHFREDRLAGLRPGRDSIEQAYRRFGKERADRTLSSAASPVWIDNCNHEQVIVQASSRQVINRITVTPTPGVTTADCDLKAYGRNARAFGTGHGLVFKDDCSRVKELYGIPESEKTIEENRQLMRAMRFSGAAGKQWTLELEVECNVASDRVQRITLTASGSLAVR